MSYHLSVKTSLVFFLYHQTFRTQNNEEVSVPEA